MINPGADNYSLGRLVDNLVLNFFRGFFAALELMLTRIASGLFFNTRVFLGAGFTNISMSLRSRRARFDASPPRFIAAIIRSRTDLALAISCSR